MDLVKLMLFQVLQNQMLILNIFGKSLKNAIPSEEILEIMRDIHAEMEVTNLLLSKVKESDVQGQGQAEKNQP